MEMESAIEMLNSAFKLTSSAGSSTSTSGVTGEDGVPSPPRLSGTKRRRMEREKLLVGMLATEKAEVAIGMLWKHWFNERGEAARLEMEAVENLMGGSGLDPKALERAASKLEKLSSDYQDWAEPLNRLAMVRFLQQRWADSIELCERVVEIKPWHFGAISGLIICYQRKGNSSELVAECVARNIPPPGPQRKAWVEKMVREIDIRQKFIL